MKSPPLLISPDNNPFYPLPRDYDTLTEKGQTLARVNACQQWLIPGTPTELADRLVISTHYFDNYYLHADPEQDFDPMFYDMEPAPTPDFHWDLSRTWAMNRLNVCMAPRGGAKSTHNRKDMLLRLCTSTYSFVYATSTHDNTKHTGQLLRDQTYTNSRINDDFGHYWGRTMKPHRGEKPTGNDYFHMTNGSWVRCVSAESRLRGLRPRRFRLDDPEYDEKATTSMQVIRDYMERLLFKVALPMVFRAKCGVDWVGTFVSRRHFLFHAMETIESPTGRRALDSRFDHWARLFIRGAYENSEGVLVSCWPEMWPLTRADKIAIGKPDLVSHEEMIELMGTASYNGEILGRPGTSDEQFFKFEPSANGRHAYWFEDVDPLLTTNLYESSTLICYQSAATKEIVKTPIGDFLRNTRLFMTVDTAYTEKASSDRRVCTLMAITRDNELFVLDIWSDRKGDSVLLRKSFEICDKWRCPSIHIEVVKESFKLFKRFESAVHTKLIAEMGFSHIPAVKPLKIGMMDKVSKISTLDLRFEHNLIKLPIWKRHETPAWGRLFTQIESFNPEADAGGLDKDDEIDTVSMTLFVVRSKPSKSGEVLTDEPLDPIKEMLAGRPTMVGGASYGMGIDFNSLDADTIGDLLKASYSSSQQSPTGTTRV